MVESSAIIILSEKLIFSIMLLHVTVMPIVF